jgi:hypothetical protein
MNIELLGRLHPAAVHLPIGIFLMALLMQYLAPRRLREEKRLVRFILFFCLLAAAGSSLLGWILSWSGDYSPAAMQRQQCPAILFTISMGLLFFFHWKMGVETKLIKWFHIQFGITFLLLLITLYYGNALTHGDAFAAAEDKKELTEEAVSGSSSQPLPEIKLPDVVAPDSMALAAALKAGFLVRPIAQASPLLEVSSVNMQQCKDGDLKLLTNLAPNIVWLQATGPGITDGAVQYLTKFKNLRKLNLKNSTIGDASMLQLAQLETLENLNLVGTKVGDIGVKALQPLKNIKKIYCWQSKVTTNGIVEFNKVHPGVLIGE